MIAKILKSVLSVALALVIIADTTLQARSMLYSGDEIFNADTILTFLAKGDYTTSHLGGYPFDPVISSGVLAMWPVGIVMALGGTLLDARLVSTFVLTVVGIGLAFIAIRSMGLGALDAALWAIALWASLQFVGNHDLRVSNPGELWGFSYLAAGVLLTRRRPAAGAFFWGLATWHCKVIYLPFGAALVLATAIAGARERGERAFSQATLRELLRLSLAFLAPLLLWMLLIWLRYDGRTVVAWLVAYLVFVVRHATGITLGIAPLPPFENWRFDPHWSTPPLFLTQRYELTLPTVIPILVGPVAFLVWLGARRSSGVAVRLMERAILLAFLSVIAVFSLWFFSGYDETQWQRHLIPAIYASIALGAYCVLDSARTVGVPRAVAQAAGVLVCVAVLWPAVRSTRALAAAHGWQTSYAAACRGANVNAAPCKQENAMGRIAELTNEICGISSRPWDQDCTIQNRARFLERSFELAAAHRHDPEKSYSAAYVVVFVEHWGYFDEEEFNRDLGRHLCALDSPIMWSYFEQARADVETMRRNCAKATPSSTAQP